MFALRVAQRVNATREEVEVILVNLILDGTVVGTIDQVKGFLQLSSTYVSLSSAST